MIDKYSVFGPPSGKPQKPTAQMQRIVTTAFEPLILHLKAQITPTPEPSMESFDRFLWKMV